MSESEEDVKPLPRPRSSKTRQSTDLLSIASSSVDTSDISKNDPINHSKSLKLQPIPRKRASIKTLDVTSDDISELTNSEHQEITNTSDVHSYRAKLKHRFQSVKAKSYKNIPKTTPKQFKSHADNVLSLNRSIELMKEKVLKIDSRLKTYKRPERSEGEFVSHTDKYHFFCESLESSVVADGTEPEIDVTVVNKKADNLSEDIEIAENDLFWNPRRSNIVLEETFTRNLEDEGLFACEPPNIPSRHLTILKQRLLTDNTKWLNSAGDIHFLQDPYLNKSYRPEGYSTSSKLKAHYVKAIPNYEELNYVVVNRSNALEIGIQNLRFTHHHLFSLEHVLQQKLIEFYDIYRDFVKTNELERLQNHLSALRKAKNIEQVPTLNGESEGDIQNVKEEVYMDQIKNIREELFKKGKIYRHNLKNILFIWRGIKKLRDSNGYSNTSIRLMIRKEYAKYDVEKEEYEAMNASTFDEYVYEASHKSKAADNDDDDPPSETSQKSVIINRKKIRTKVKNIMESSFKEPGEPCLHFSLCYENEITKVVDAENEILRRNEVKATKLFFKIICDGIEVCKSKHKTLSDSFDCFFGESFSIQLETVPQFITIQVHEQRSLLNKFQIGEIELKIPPRDVIIGHNKMNEESFKTQTVISYKHNGVGSGSNWKNYFKELNLECINEYTLSTSGFMITNIGWLSNDSNNYTENKIQQSFLNTNGTINIEKLTEWIENENPDPQNPKNTVIFNYLKKSEHKPSVTNKSKQYFRCDPYIDKLFIEERHKIEDNIRFQLLQLRDNNEPEFVGLTIPNRLKEIPTNILSSYNRRIAEENFEENVRDEFDNEINARRSQARKYLRQVHTKIFQLCRNAENNLSFEDVINESDILVIQTFIKSAMNAFFNWFKSMPPPEISISTESLSKAKPPRLTESISTPKITFHLSNALNIPSRFIAQRKRSGKSQGSSNKSEETVEIETQTFIEIIYGDYKVRSSTKSGKNPTWNEKLVLTLDPSTTDYLSPNAMNGNIVINLYDEFEDSKIFDEKIFHWLGCVEIPISAISQASQLDGLFCVNTPVSIIGYDQEYEMHQTSANRIKNLAKNHAFATYLNLKVNIEPSVSKLSPDMTSLPTNEPSYLREHILNWNEQFNNSYPNRKFLALAIDETGKSICITRYIKSLELPQINDDGFDVTADQCARYVQEIPFTTCNKFYQSIWLPVEKLLKLGLGSIIDHAIALTCYFLTLGMETWLLLGFGIPHGNAAYVLVREYSGTNIPDHYVYDVVTAKKFNVLDTFCPLQRIYCVLNENNVWGNIQRGDDIATTRFDFSRRFDWLPLFSNQLTSPTSSIQNRLIYVSSYDYSELQKLIVKRIRRKAAKIRTHHRTIWNHYVSSIFEKLINRMELNVMHNQQFTSVTPEMQEIMRDYHINGSVFNMSFSSVNNIVEKILETKIFDVVVNDVEFALAVHVHLFPNQILSIWLAIGYLIKTNY